MMNERVAAHPFQAGKWYRLGELRRVAAEMIGARQADPALSAIMRVQSAKWAKDWNEELYPLKVFADHKALSDNDEFCWTPDAAADFIVRASTGTIKIQSTMAYAEWEDTIAKQGGHLHKLEMIQSNKAGHSYPGGLVSEPNARHPYTDVDAWRRGIAKAVRNKLRPGYTDCYLVIFALRCRFQTIDFAFAQVVRPAIEQVGVAECARAFRGLYVFDDQPPAIFELNGVIHVSATSLQ
jgi:hypothetical protein